MADAIRRVINGDAIHLLPSFAHAEPVRAVWEPRLYERFKAALGPGMVVLDVGASFGLYALAAARAVGPSGRVIAFEPAAETASALREHLRLNGVEERVEVIEAAVSERTTVETFWQQETSFVASLVETATRQEAGESSAPLETRRVPAVKLDDFCRERRLEPDVLKIDVEGAEADVLRGAREILERRRAVVFLETHDGTLRAAGRSADDVFRELERAGWRYEKVEAGPETRHWACAPA